MQSALQSLQPPAAQALVKVQLLLLHVVMEVQLQIRSISVFNVVHAYEFVVVWSVLALWPVLSCIFRSRMVALVLASWSR